MILKQLHLKAYGSFSDTTVDFSGPEGLHLVWGPNEAGKSVTLRALTAALFGIPSQTKDNFLHDNRALRIGAVVRHSDGTELAFIRRKGNKDTLLDENESPIADNSLSKFLGPITSDLFTKMFGLTLDQLVAGGSDLATGGGDLGAALFAAGAGIGNLRNVLTKLDSEADALFTPQAHTRTINTLLSKYRKLATDAKEVSLSAKDWQALERALQEHGETLREIESEIQDNRIVELRLTRISKAASLVGELADTDGELKALGKVIVLPDDFREKRLENEKEVRETSAQLLRLADKLDATEKAIKELESPGTLLEHGDEIDRLFVESGNYRQGRTQLPKLEPEVDRLEDLRAKSIRELASGGPAREVDELYLQVAERAEIERLAEVFPGLTSGVNTAQEELENSEAEMQLQEAAIEQEDPPDVSSLESFLAALSEEGISPKQRDDLARECEDESDTVQVRLDRLGLWTGTLEEFETTPDVPSDGAVSQFEDRLSDIAAESNQIATALDEEQQELLGLRGQITQLQAGQEILTKKDVESSRARREEGWSLVKMEWLEELDVSEPLQTYAPDAESLKEAYERSVSGADSVADSLMSGSERSAQLEALTARMNAGEEKIQGLEERTATVEAGRDEVNREWRDIWSACGVEPRSPREMRDWLQDRARILESAEKVRRLNRKVASLSSTIGAREESLKELLREVGQTPPAQARIGQLRQQATAQIEETRRQLAEKGEQNALFQRAKGAVELRGAKLAIEKATMNQWLDDWTSALEPTWLSDDFSAKQATAVLEHLADLAAISKSLDEKASRIRSIKADHIRFEDDVKVLSQAVEWTLGDLDPADFVKQLQGALKDALKEHVELDEKESARDDIKNTIDELEAKMGTASEALQAQVDAAGCEAAGELPEAEQRSTEFLSRKSDANNLRKQVSQIAEQKDVTGFIAEVEATDSDQSKAELTSIREKIAKLGETKSDTNQEIGALENELGKMEGGDAALQIAEEREGILVEIRAASEEYARLRVSSAILKKEIERYREEHQGPVMKQASEIFKNLTQGSFDGLTSDFDRKDNQIIVGQRGGDRITVSGMSTATRVQLFLALRLASLETRNETQESIPLILDDILVDFDDERAGACLQVLAAIAKQTQIILFTHHSHILDIAEKELGEGAYAVQSLS